MNNATIAQNLTNVHSAKKDMAGLLSANSLFYELDQTVYPNSYQGYVDALCAYLDIFSGCTTIQCVITEKLIQENHNTFRISNISLAEKGVPCVIMWGDGQQTTVTESFSMASGTSPAQHTYASPGKYTVRISNSTTTFGMIGENYPAVSIFSTASKLSALDNQAFRPSANLQNIYLPNIKYANFSPFYYAEALASLNVDGLTSYYGTVVGQCSHNIKNKLKRVSFPSLEVVTQQLLRGAGYIQQLSLKNVKTIKNFEHSTDRYGKVVYRYPIIQFHEYDKSTYEITSTIKDDFKYLDLSENDLSVTLESGRPICDTNNTFKIVVKSEQMKSQYLQNTNWRAAVVNYDERFVTLDELHENGLSLLQELNGGL